MTRRSFVRSAALAIPGLSWIGNNALFATSPAPSAAAFGPIVAGNTAFGTDLFGQLGKKSGNLFFSPFSVSAALAMTSAGAAGGTLDEMVKTLHLPADQNELHSGFAALSRQLTDAASKGGYELQIANALWGMTGFPFRDDFKALVAKYYGAGFQTVDFAQSEVARQKINRWVEQQTKDKIKDLFPEGSIQGDTRLVLANAIYFKGMWATQFQPRHTSDAMFFGPDKADKVPTMHLTSQFGYAETNTWQLLEMRYKNCDLVMNVILPRAKDGLPAIEAKLNSSSLHDAVTGVKPEKVTVSLPKFKTTLSYDLTGTIAAMGMPKAFSRSEADFSRMTSADRLKIGVIVHKAFVDVTEQGTEAAAATGIGVRATSAPVQEEPKVFNADHPFLFAIRDTKSGSVLFMGRMTKPA